MPPSKEIELYISGKKQYAGKEKLLLKLANQIIKETREANPHEA